jgi:hypothetical protein
MEAFNPGKRCAARGHEPGKSFPKEIRAKKGAQGATALGFSALSHKLIPSTLRFAFALAFIQTAIPVSCFQ